MAFVRFTRPDKSPVSINSNEVVQLSPVPTSGSLKGPSASGTRVEYLNNKHQDILELLDEVAARINEAERDGGQMKRTRPAKP